MASVRTPISTSLVCDNPVRIDVAEHPLGAPVVPSAPQVLLQFADAGWHNDDGIGVRGVKLATHLDPLDARRGILRFVPCSHHDKPDKSQRWLADGFERARQHPRRAPVAERLRRVGVFDLPGAEIGW